MSGRVDQLPLAGERRSWQPAWMAFAWRELGQREAVGAASNPRVRALYRDAGHAEVQHDEVAWCAAYVGACLARAGIPGTRSLLARSYLAWGEHVTSEQPGALAVLRRGADPGAGHVGFLVGFDEDHLYLLCGNQGDAVAVAAFDRADVLDLRWPLPAPSAEPVAERAFDVALRHVLEMEGGWSNDPYDPGGPTNFGITLATYAAHKGVAVVAGSLAALTAELRAIPQEMVREIYLGRYWRPSHSAELPAGLALMHFDAAVNHGVGGAARMLQQALRVAADGEIGTETLATARASSLGDAIDRYAEIRRTRYRSLGHFWRFGRGWLARVDKTRAAAFNDLTQNPTSNKEPAMTTVTPIKQPTTAAAPKWWGQSLTIWGAIVTTLATVLPTLGPVIGIDVSGDMIRELGEQLARAVQAIGGLVGVAMTVYGRVRATQPLVRRDVLVRL